MISLHPQFVVDERMERKAVLLSPEEWELILDELEELEDIRAWDKAKSRSQDSVPFEQAVREVEEGEDI